MSAIPPMGRPVSSYEYEAPAAPTKTDQQPPTGVKPQRAPEVADLPVPKIVPESRAVPVLRVGGMGLISAAIVALTVPAAAPVAPALGLVGFLCLLGSQIKDAWG